MTTDKELIAKIKELKKIQPDEKWVGFCRTQIISRIQEEKTEPVGGFASSLWQLFYQPATAVISAAFVFVVMGAMATIAAKDSLPGDYAYPLKITFEKAQITMVLDETARTKKEAEITNRRVDELTEVIRQPLSENNSRVEKAVEQLGEQLSTAKKTIPKLRGKMEDMTKGESQKIAEAAKAVQDSAAKVEEVLAEVKGSLSENNTFATKISDISDIAGKTGEEVSEIIQIVESIEKITIIDNKNVSGEIGDDVSGIVVPEDNGEENVLPVVPAVPEYPEAETSSIPSATSRIQSIIDEIR